MADDYYGWLKDAPSGVYKNHFISNKLLELSALQFQLAQFLKPVPGYGKGMGETANFFHYKDLAVPADPTILEADTIPLDTLEMGSHSITVTEWGHGVEITSLAKDFSKFDPDNAAQKKLMKQQKTVMENKTAAAFKTAKICAIGTGAGAVTWDVDGTPSSLATVNLDLGHVGIIRDYMKNNLHVPPVSGGDYVCLATTKALRGLKSDELLQTWAQYLQKGDLLYNSEVGRAENFRFVEVNLESALSNDIGTADVTGEALFFGDESVAIAEAVPLHLVFQPNKNNDFGRRHAVAWYGVLELGIWWPTANDMEAKIVRWTSSVPT